MSEIWDKEYDTLNKASCNRFRANTDISDWVVEKWNFMTGKFEPISQKQNKLMELSDDNREVVKAIENHKYKILCINDGSMNYDFEKAKRDIINAFEKEFPDKSSFEL
jgi:hypothetical protein